MSSLNRRVLSVFGVNPFRIGGTEVFARELSAQLAERAWASVLAFTRQAAEPVRRYLELPNVSLEVVENPSQFRWQPVRDLGRILRRYRPRILHLHFTEFLGSYPWLGRLYGVKQIFFTSHLSHPAFHVPRRSRLWKRIVTRVINSPMTGVVCVSDYGYRCMTAMEVLPSERIRRIYNAVDVSHNGGTAREAVSFRQIHSIPPGRALVVQVSNMIPEKGIADLLEAARLVLAQNPNVHFALVGDGACRERFTQRASEMGLADHVTWTGPVVDPLAEGVYAAADVVCQVSRWEEVFGWTIAEAMACYRPVVATRVGGIPELVQDGQTGFLVCRGDAPAMTEKILLLLSDRGLREQMGAAARKAVEANFNLKTNVAELLQFYGIGPARC